MKIENLKVGTRLGIGFAVVLVMAVISTAIAIWNLRQVATATQRMMETPLTKERTVSDWYRNISSAIIRTSFIIESNDNTLSEKFSADIAAGARKAGAIQDTFELTSDKEKAIYEEIKSYREKFQVAKAAAMKAKQTNDPAEIARVYQTQFKPVAQRYEQVVQTFLKLQQQTIDDIARQIAELYGRSFRLSIALCALIVLLGAVCAWLITQSITRPLTKAIGIARTVAAGDLSSHIETRSHDETGQLMKALKDMNGNLLTLVSSVRQSADSIATASQEIATGNLDLSSRTEQQAASLEETASSVEELTSIVRQNAHNAENANELAVSASAIAAEGGAMVLKVVETMDAINESAQKIVEIISVIDGIAFQTNILALNAAVEAARAGDQGRGFAVVASEVRSLAQRSAGAAKEIKNLIDDSVNRTDTGVKLVRKAGVTISKAVESARAVTAVMHEISVASREQTAGIEQVNRTISLMDEATQQNAALVEEAAAAAGSLRNQTDTLRQMVSVFRIVALPAPTVIDIDVREAVEQTRK